MLTLDVVVAARHDLGEVPVWCATSERLYWTDVRACRIHALAPASGALETFELPDWAGALALQDDGQLLVASRKSLLSLDLSDRRLAVRATFEDRLPSNRSNDGRCDRQGRFWFGTLNNAERIATGSLYCATGAGGAVRIDRRLAEIIVPNALAWSPDGRTMYFADSWVGHLWAHDFDPDDGALSNRRVLVDKTALPGIPDGATVDAEGCIWHARYGAGQVVRVTPAGAIDKVLHCAAQQPTACTLGGTDLRDLYVTSACQRLEPAALAAQPLAGSLFAARVATPGLPEPRFVS